MDLSKSFCENINKLSSSPGLKLTDFGKKSANSVPRAVTPPARRRNPFAHSPAFTRNVEEQTPKSVTNKRINDLKMQPKAMISSPSIMDEKPRSVDNKKRSPSPNFFADSKKPRIDGGKYDRLFEQMKSSNGIFPGRKEKKEESGTKPKDDNKSKDQEQDVVVVIDEPKKDDVADIPPLVPFEVTVPRLDCSWIKRMKQEQANFQKAIDCLKTIK
jgi:hypothetical protein